MVDKIGLDELDRFNELGIQVNSNFVNLFSLNDILNSEFDYVYGYYLDSKLVGFIHLNEMYENIDIVNIVVDKDYRRKGIGNSLLKYVINLFDDVTGIMLEVNENNQQAIKLYNKLGFKEISLRDRYYGEDTAIIMEKVK